MPYPPLIMGVPPSTLERWQRLQAIRRYLLAAGARPPGLGNAVALHGLDGAEAILSKCAASIGVTIADAESGAPPQTRLHFAIRGDGRPDITRERAALSQIDDDWGDDDAGTSSSSPAEPGPTSSSPTAP